MRVAGFVLVGGRSTRMGCDKARLQVGPHSLVEQIAGRVAEVTDSVALVGRPESFADLGIECLPDIRPGLGPLAGLETALRSTRAELNLITSCDIPDLRVEWLRALIATAEETRARCVIGKDITGRVHPLCGVYRRACLPFVNAALDSGRLRLLELVKELRATELAVDFEIANLNTPGQLASWRARHSA